jgi:uncharacterized protein
MLHNYGFFSAAWRGVLYPRALSSRWQAFMKQHVALRRQVLRFCKQVQSVHPRELEQAIGRNAHQNGWGGSSSVTTMMLEGLHREGKLQVARRDAGIRVYAVAAPIAQSERMSVQARADAVIEMIVNLYAPLPMRTLTHLISMMGAYRPDRKASVDYKKRIERLLKQGTLVSQTIEGLEYVWTQALPLTPANTVDDRVRLLAPFDPLVWDRRRFEHLWGWSYRFEAYTPAAKRKLGYYALPLLWRDQVIGWANATMDQQTLDVQLGYITTAPRETSFKTALASELERLRLFLRLKNTRY